MALLPNESCTQPWFRSVYWTWNAAYSGLCGAYSADNPQLDVELEAVHSFH